MRVLRLGPGDEIRLADPRGREASAVLRSVGAEGVSADVSEPHERPAGPRVALAQGLARRERMEFVVQKTTEIGVSEILPIAFTRSIVHLDEERGAKRAVRWRRIAGEAAKQSQRADVPDVREPSDLDGLIAAAASFDVVLLPWEEEPAGAAGVRDALAAAGADPQTSVLVVIGPEGGLTADEVARLREAGARTLTLGERILRTETAAVVAIALVLHELGGLGGAPRV